MKANYLNFWKRGGLSILLVWGTLTMGIAQYTVSKTNLCITEPATGNCTIETTEFSTLSSILATIDITQATGSFRFKTQVFRPDGSSFEGETWGPHVSTNGRWVMVWEFGPQTQIGSYRIEFLISNNGGLFIKAAERNFIVKCPLCLAISTDAEITDITGNSATVVTNGPLTIGSSYVWSVRRKNETTVISQGESTVGIALTGLSPNTEYDVVASLKGSNGCICGSWYGSFKTIPFIISKVTLCVPKITDQGSCDYETSVFYSNQNITASIAIEQATGIFSWKTRVYRPDGTFFEGSTWGPGTSNNSTWFWVWGFAPQTQIGDYRIEFLISTNGGTFQKAAEALFRVIPPIENKITNIEITPVNPDSRSTINFKVSSSIYCPYIIRNDKIVLSGNNITINIDAIAVSATCLNPETPSIFENSFQLSNLPAGRYCVNFTGVNMTDIVGQTCFNVTTACPACPALFNAVIINNITATTANLNTGFAAPRGSVYVWRVLNTANNVVFTGESTQSIIATGLTPNTNYTVLVSTKNANACLCTWGGGDFATSASCNNKLITLIAEICEGSTYTLPKGKVVSTNGGYVDTFKISGGCDSIISTALFVKPAERRTLTPSVCGTNYTLPDGRVVTSSGTYTAVRTGAAVNGCDSIYTINLTLSDSIVRNVSASINQGQNYTLPSGVVVSNAGTYRSVLKRVSGCDSIIYTALMVNTIIVDTTSCRYKDSLQLVILYNSTNGASWINKWDLSKSITTWYGIKTNTEGCVTDIDLDGIADFKGDDFTATGNGLVGNLPSLTFSELIFLDLDANQRLKGNLPHLNLPKVKLINLSKDSLSGTIPSSWSFPKLEYLALCCNQLDGILPTLSFPNLIGIYLQNNKLRGALPIINAPSLTDIRMNDNQLSGCFPLSYRQFCSISNSFSRNPALANGGDFTLFCNKNIGGCQDTNSCRYRDSLALITFYNATNGDQWFNTQRNDKKWKVVGVPISNWHGVTLNTEGCVFKIELNDNNLKGQLPNLDLPNLQVLSLWQNQLSGTIPNFNLPNLQELVLVENQLNGTIPNFNLPNLGFLFLYDNQLSGVIPNFNLPKLYSLSLSGNQLSGSIPNFNLPNLLRLYLYDNQLSGSVPNFNLLNLQTLWLGNNQLSGAIPNFNFPNLTGLYLESNQLSGTIPNFNFPKLEGLYINNNHFDSLPMLSFPTLKKEITNSILGFRSHSNELTFDDILPNIGFTTTATFIYTPQDSIFKDTTITAKVGDPLSIDLKIDGALTTNSYQWYKNGQIYGSPLSTNKFIINTLSTTDAGAYDVRVTNPNAPLLTLQSRKITVIVSALSTRNRNKTICEGKTDTLPSGKIVSTANIYQDTLKNRSGIDSAIVVTNLKISSKMILNFGSFQACRGQSNGSVSLTIQGGTAPFTYQWDNGIKTLNLTNVAAGTYRVTVTDTVGCQNDNAIVVNSQAPKAAIVGKDSICPNETTLLTASGGVSYLWNGSNNSNPLSISTAGIYTVVVTDDKGCKDTTRKSVFIKIPIQKRFNRMLCQGDKFNNIVINKDTIFTETYCDSIVTTTIRISKEMSFALAPKQACEGQGNGSIVLIVTGGIAPYIYVWSNQTTQKDALNLPPQQYNVVVTDSVGCKRASDRITIASVPTNKAVIAGKDSICLKETIPLTATGGTSYEWSSSQLSNKPKANPLSISSAGRYIVVATDANGCTAKDSITIRNVLVQNIIVDTIVCEGSLFKNRTINVDVSFSDTIGCNRVEQYRVKVKKVQNITRTTSVCKGEYVDGILIQKDTILTKAYGCDSLIKLSVSIKPIKSSNIDLSVCKGDIINGIVINKDTSLTETIRCDSIVIKRIKVNPTYNISLKDSASIGDNYKGTVVTGDTTLTFRDKTKAGCDSITTVQIFIKKLPQPPCQKRDAPILAVLYNATNGNAWTKNDNWLSNEPLSKWHGITTNTEGCVTEISLPNNKLNGTLPKNLELLNLEVLVLSKNQIKGNIPDFNLPKLKRLILFENDLSGIVPSLNLPELESFQFHKNKIDSCPPLLNLKKLKKDTTVERGFRTFGNKLTFDDILPNINFATTATFIYAPQDSIFKDTTFETSSCSDLTIDLGIDAAIANNKYIWKKDGNPFREEKTNKLTFNGIDEADEGVYTCEVTNDQAKGLTLNSRSIRIKITEGNSNNPLKFEFFNGLTPNGDGKNDVFLIESIEKCTQNNLVILNRFGETVFKKDSYQNDWNGVDLKGNNLPEGQYYFVFFPKKGGQKYLKGSILILR
jgi:gliding motility-associated-like protein